MSTQKIIPTINIEYIDSYPKDSTPVSFDQSNNIVSKFGDKIWDFSNYIFSPHSINCLNFDNFFKNCNDPSLHKKIIYELKLIIYGFIYCNTNSGKNFSIQTIITIYLQLIKKLFNFAIDYNSSLSGISSNQFLLTKIFNYISLLNKKEFSFIFNIFKKLSALSIVYNKHNFSLNQKQFKEMLSIKLTLRNDPIKQHLVIPSTLYLNLINFINHKIKSFEQEKNKFLELYKIKYTKRNSFNFKYEIQRLKLGNYCLENSIKHINHIEKHIANIICLSFTNIIIFTGMRHGEALLLPYNCFEEIVLDNREIYIINGYTSKMHHNLIKTNWITSKNVKTSIQVLQSISYAYLEKSGLSLETIDFEQVPLCSFRARPPQKVINKPLYLYVTSRSLVLIETLKALDFNFKVSENDLKELELTTPFFNLEEYNVRLGENFPFTPHQFRRTLSVYAARSGFVKLPALKAQLKHIKQDMTEYYCNYAGDSINLFEKDLVDLFKEEIILDQYSNFEEDVINTNGFLYGAEGTRLENSKKNEVLPFFLTDEKTTLKAFRDGKISYRRTPLGGCSRLSRCDEITELTITSCITCKDAIFSNRTAKALKKALIAFEIQLSNFEPESPFAIHLNAEINQLNSLLNKLNQLQGKLNGK